MTGHFNVCIQIFSVLKTNKMSEHLQSNPASKGNNGNSDHSKLHIFINKVKYDETDGVKESMTGRELAALIPVDPNVIEITRLTPHEEKIGIDQVISIKMADHFEIIRTNVQAG
jgi:hypothetical protein